MKSLTAKYFLSRLPVKSIALSNPRRFFESKHPMIQQVAQLLKGGDSWKTATNVWEFVRSMPYRFGIIVH
jgi:hypothetical protein